VGHKARLAEIYGKLEQSKNSGGLVATDYISLKNRLANNKGVTREFNANEKLITVRAENMVLLNKLRDISQGK
jgi:hypothetical protein